MSTHVDKSGDVARLEVVQHCCLVEVGQVRHVVHLLKLGRIHRLDVVFFHSLLLESKSSEADQCFGHVTCGRRFFHGDPTLVSDMFTGSLGPDPPYSPVLWRKAARQLPLPWWRRFRQRRNHPSRPPPSSFSFRRKAVPRRSASCGPPSTTGTTRDRYKLERQRRETEIRKTETDRQRQPPPSEGISKPDNFHVLAIQ